MSLQQLLQGYAQDISAKEEHANGIADDIRDRKVQSADEQLQNHLDVLNSAATELGVASGAFHLGRKVYSRYKKGKEVYGKVEKLVNDIKAKANGAGKPTGEEGEGGSGEGAEPSRPLGSTDGDRDAPDGGSGAEGESRTATQDNGSGVDDSSRATDATTEESGGGSQPTNTEQGSADARPAQAPAEQGADSADAPRNVGAEQPPTRTTQQPDVSTEELQSNLDEAQSRFNSLSQQREGLRNTMDQAQETMDKYRNTPATERPLEFDQAQDTFNRTGQALDENDTALGQANADVSEARANLGRRQAQGALEEAQDLESQARQRLASVQATPGGQSTAPHSDPSGDAPARGQAPEAPEPTSQATGDLGRNITSEQDQFESGVRALSGRTAELESGAVRGGESALTQAGAVAQDTINGVRSGVGNIVENTANKALTAVKSTLPESIGDFLGSGAGEVLSAGLDALPVVGEVASVVTGLVSLFEGLDKKKEDAQAQAKAVTGNVSGVAQTAIDPTAITKAQPVMGATLV